MKKKIALGLSATLLLLSLAACGDDAPPAANGDDAAGAMKGSITVISREDGSGTRGAFVELFGIEERAADGKKIDMTTDAAEITNSTSVMLTSVQGDPNAIGYLSLGSLSADVKALKIDGVSPSVEAIKDGSYSIARPFNIATKGEASPLAADFLAFMMSSEGQDIVEEKGYIRVEDTGAFAGSLPTGKLVIGGSSSVSPVMEVLVEAYQALNTGAQIELQSTDSSTGMNSVLEGICEIGMASRELKSSETDAGLTPSVIALDGIVVAVNPENSLEGLSKDQVREIYTGALSDWSEVQ